MAHQVTSHDREVEENQEDMDYYCKHSYDCRNALGQASRLNAIIFNKTPRNTTAIRHL